MNAYTCKTDPEDYVKNILEEQVVIANTLREAVRKWEASNPRRCLKAVWVIAEDVILSEPY